MGLYRGANGAEFEIDVPAEGTNAREIFDRQIEAGDLAEVAPAKKAAPVAKKAAEEDDDE